LNREKIIEIGLKKKKGEINQSWEELNTELGHPFKNGESYRSFIKRYTKLEYDNSEKEQEIKKEHNKFNDTDLKNKYKSSHIINSDGTHTSDKTIEMSEEEEKDPEYLLMAHGFTVKDWILISARNNTWNAYSKQDGIQTLYSSKIVVKPRVEDISLEELEKHFEEFNKKYKKPIIQKKNIHSNHFFELPLMDLHLGKLGWHGEIGEDYDHKIAEERFLTVINDFIQRTKNYKFENIIFPIGQDFFNFSTIEGSTINGTPQDNDLRWQKLFLKGVELLVQGIDLLSDVAPVNTFYVGGNHDKTTSYYALNYIYAWFRNNKNILVDRSPKMRKYIHIGNCLIGYTHGDMEKKRISNIMQIEAPEAWGNSKFREWHCGHIHSEHTKEEGGIIIRNISSVTGTDAWHYETGYVGAIKKAQGFIWDKQYGLIEILNSIII
jgi:predicted phosphodiesterase